MLCSDPFIAPSGFKPGRYGAILFPVYLRDDGCRLFLHNVARWSEAVAGKALAMGLRRDNVRIMKPPSSTTPSTGNLEIADIPHANNASNFGWQKAST